MELLQEIIDIIFPPSETEARLCKMRMQGTLPAAPPIPHSNIYAAVSYQETIIRKSVRILKNRHNRKIARCFAQLLHENLQTLLQEKEPFTKYNRVVIVPLPITRTRLLERGFNQTELLAHELQKLQPDFYSVKKLLEKIRETKKQAVSISKTRRRENIKGCFHAIKDPKEFVSNENTNTVYVILDDVVTTGATMNEAIKVLRAKKYKPVIGIAVAH